MTRLSPEALSSPDTMETDKQGVEERIKKECPDMTWHANYAVLGPCDYIDIFEAPDSETATKVSLLVRSFGHATTETWVATPWDRFATMTSEMAY
jgi:uncharacterized protein with GYD domain